MVFYDKYQSFLSCLRREGKLSLSLGFIRTADLRFTNCQKNFLPLAQFGGDKSLTDLYIFNTRSDKGNLSERFFRLIAQTKELQEERIYKNSTKKEEIRRRFFTLIKAIWWYKMRTEANIRMI
ncbi:MAG: hypothetical protein LUH08_06295 [Ruminococcus sp.]|nr:hypothetical protein [Ruminococcus sp.]